MSPTTTSATLNYITPAEAPQHNGQVETVRFQVASTYTDSAGTEFLDQDVNYRYGFVVCIFSSDLSNFQNDPATTYQGHSIEVKGEISQYNGYWQILNPSSIDAVN